MLWSSRADEPRNDNLRTLGCAALGVAAFRDLLDDLAGKCLKVTRIARGDDALVDDDLRILPLSTGIDAIGFDRMIRGRLTALDDAGFDQQPWGVAHRRHDFLLIE